MKCEARKAEKIIAATGKLIGLTLTLGRPLNARNATEIRDNKFSLTPGAERRAAIERRKATKAFQARESERNRLCALGVMFVQDQPETD